MKKETESKKLSMSAALVGGLIVAALSFSAGALGARSHKAGDEAVSAAPVAVSTSAADERSLEPLASHPADQGAGERRVAGHSECDLQLD